MKRFMLSLVLMILGVLVLNIVLYQFIELPMVAKVERVADAGVDVVFLGDSCVVEVAPEDVDLRNLSDMLDDKLSELDVVSLANYAFHGELFEGISGALARGKEQPSVVLIPVNLRSFSPSWDLRPEYQFEKMKHILRYRNVLGRSLVQPLVVFKWIDLNPITQGEYEATPLFFAGESLGLISDAELPKSSYEDEKEFYRKQFLGLYGYTLVEEHRKLQGIVESVRILEEADIVPIVYVTPLDHEGALRYGGEALLDRIRGNVNIVAASLTRASVPLYDFSDSFDSEVFCYEETVHEHLNEAGRLEFSEILMGLTLEKLEPSRL